MNFALRKHVLYLTLINLVWALNPVWAQPKRIIFCYNTGQTGMPHADVWEDGEKLTFELHTEGPPGLYFTKHFNVGNYLYADITLPKLDCRMKDKIQIDCALNEKTVITFRGGSHTEVRSLKEGRVGLKYIEKAPTSEIPYPAYYAFYLPVPDASDPTGFRIYNFGVFPTNFPDEGCFPKN